MTVLITPNDLIPVQISDITFYFSPLKRADTQKMQTALSKYQGMSQQEIIERYEEMTKVSLDIVRKTLKKVEGIQKSDGSEWSLEKDLNGEVTENSMEQLMYLPQDVLMGVVTIAGKVIAGQVKEGKVFDDKGNELPNIEVKKSIPASR